MENTKICRICKIEQPLESYYKTRVGRRDICKACCKDVWPHYTRRPGPKAVNMRIEEISRGRETRAVSYGGYLIGFCVSLDRSNILATSVHGRKQLFSSVANAKLFLINETRKASEKCKRYLK